MFERPGWWAAVLVFYFMKEVNGVKIKIMTFLLILVVGLSCLGVDSDVAYAYTSDDIVSVDGSKYLGLGSEREYSYSYLSEYVFVLTSGGFSNSSYDILYYSNSPIYSFSIRENPHDGDLYTFCDVVFSESPLCYGHFIEDGVTRTDYYTYQRIITMSDGKEYYVICKYCWRARPNSLTSGAIDYVSYVDVGCVPQDIDKLFSVFLSNYDFPPKIFTYNPDLGYLKNVTQKMISLNAPEGGVDYTSAQLKISFDGLSTTDVDLSTGEYKVRLYEQGCYYNNGIVSVYKEDYPLIEIGDYSIIDNSITFSVADAFEKCTNETEGWLSSWDMFWIHCERSDNLYLQIIKTGSDGSEEYGGLVKLAYPVDSNGQIYSSTYFPDLTPDQDGYTGDKVDSGSGSGTNYEDAELNADKDLENNINNPNFSGDITNDMNSLISFIGAVPQLLAALLGFLPQHYKSLIYVSIALALVLVVVKR